MVAAPELVHRVVFTPSGRSGQVSDGMSVLDAARTLGVDLDSLCAGRGRCGRCQVRPVVREEAGRGVVDSATNLSRPADLEADYRGRRPLGPDHRLGCAARVQGDVVLDVPPGSQLHKPVVRKGVVVDDLVVDPLVRLYFVTLPPPDPDAPVATALDRLRAQLAADWGVSGCVPDFAVLPSLHPALATGAEGVTVAVRGTRLVAVWPGLVERLLGVALDVGSTTLAGHLVDLAAGEVLATAGRMNPQIRFGEDLMSRVAYAMSHGAADMTTAVRAGLDELVRELADTAGVDVTRILDLVIVGNPVMQHLTLGLDPSPLGQAPFTLATADAVVVGAPRLDLGCPAAEVYVGPCIAGHVGADMAAAILAEGPHRSESVQLLVDVGTNAEIVLGNHDGLWAASSPTGPAFEGAQLSSGQRATDGAIERVRIDPATLEPRIRVIGCDAWSDEPGFDAAAVTGICGSGIIEVIAELFLAGAVDASGALREAGECTGDRIVADGRTSAYVLWPGPGELRITQADIRAVQLAKAALRAGIELLMDHAGISEIDEVRLAGAFGAHIDPLRAMVLGLIPDMPLERVSSVGNAAGAGAVRALVSNSQRAEMEAVVRTVTRVETATEPRFQTRFVAALGIPHTTAPRAHLASLVDLPVARAATDQRRRRAGGRASRAAVMTGADRVRADGTSRST